MWQHDEVGITWFAQPQQQSGLAVGPQLACQGPPPCQKHHATAAQPTRMLHQLNRAAGGMQLGDKAIRQYRSWTNDGTAQHSAAQQSTAQTHNTAVPG